MMKSLEQLLESYGAYHTKRATFYTHVVGVPLVVFSLLIFTSWLRLSVEPLFNNFPLTWFLIAALGIYYIRLDLKIGLPVFLVLCLMTFLAATLTWQGINSRSLTIFLLCFVGGWIIQLMGHGFEGRRPALFDNLSQVFTAPLFVVIEALVLFGFRKENASHAHERTRND